MKESFDCSIFLVKWIIIYFVNGFMRLKYLGENLKYIRIAAKRRKNIKVKHFRYRPTKTNLDKKYLYTYGGRAFFIHVNISHNV